jgi:hypothetical protein
VLGGCAGQFEKQSIAIGNVPGLPDFQSSEERLCVRRVLAAAFQRCDQLPLVSDIPFTMMETAFGFVQELLYRGAVHTVSLQPNRRRGVALIAPVATLRLHPSLINWGVLPM